MTNSYKVLYIMKYDFVEIMIKKISSFEKIEFDKWMSALHHIYRGNLQQVNRFTMSGRPGFGTHIFVVDVKLLTNS